MIKQLKKLEKNLNVTFTTKQILEEALTHRSYLNEARYNIKSNERLEFLGDAILAYLCSNYLFKNFPNHPEGMLTNLRSSLVRTSTLAQVAAKLNLGEFMLLSKGEEEGGGRSNQSLLADCFEAIVGAIFLDQGIKTVSSFVEKNLISNLADIIKKGEVYDFKSRFQEVVQEKLRISPTYTVLQEQGPDHDKIFAVGVFVGNKQWGEGCGKSKQLAEQEAAREALEKYLKKS